MKLGLITAICEGMTFEEVVDFAAENGLECLEVACWPQGGAQRRYAGVSHIDVANLDEEKANDIKNLCAKKGVEISALAYYPNTLDPDLEKRQSYIAHLYKLIDASAMLDVNMITTFIGRVPTKNFSENLEIVKEVWPPILEYAQKKGIDPEEVMPYFKKNIPIHRLVDLQDVINAAVFLLTDNSAYLTGQSINLTGGEWMD